MTRRTVVWSGVCVLAVISLLPSLPRVKAAGPIGRFANSTPDTVVHFGPNTYTRGSSGTWTSFADSIYVANYDSTRRYFFRITNGTSGGANRVSQLSIQLNGKEVMSASDVTTSIYQTIKIVKPKAANSVQISVAGTAGAYVVIDLVSTPDPSYAIDGPWTFVLAQDPPDPVPPGGYYEETPVTFT